jgi:hypothetical protein
MNYGYPGSRSAQKAQARKELMKLQVSSWVCGHTWVLKGPGSSLGDSQNDRPYNPTEPCNMCHPGPMFNARGERLVMEHMRGPLSVPGLARPTETWTRPKTPPSFQERPLPPQITFGFPGMEVGGSDQIPMPGGIFGGGQDQGLGVMGMPGPQYTGVFGNRLGGGYRRGFGGYGGGYGGGPGRYGGKYCGGYDGGHFGGYGGRYGGVFGGSFFRNADIVQPTTADTADDGESQALTQSALKQLDAKKGTAEKQ